MHERNSAKFLENFERRFGRHAELEVVRDLDLLVKRASPLRKRDYAWVMSLGGDGTFLRVASLIGDPNLPLLGVCSDSCHSMCGLTQLTTEQEDVEELLQRLFEE